MKRLLSLLLVFLVPLTLAACGDESSKSTDTTGDTGGDMTGDSTGDTPTPDTSPDVNPGDMGGDTDMAVDMFVPPPPDADGDGISDVDEGEGLVDTDMDGTPDSMDEDSDGDGILDSVEAGDTDPRTVPVDSDGDGIPDFRDEDSDGNGILDSIELDGDLDGDTILDYADSDNDGDGVLDPTEIVGETADCDGDGMADPPGDAANPRDCDMDGTPDYLTTDSDGDFIPDRLEGSTTDTDMDTFLDRYDADTDGDGIPDAVEAGDMDLTTPPVDSDADGLPDFRDLDSDNDGLSDAAELAAGSDPTQGDSDMDGVSDLIEVAAGTDPNNPADNPQANGDFVFLVPYMAPTSPDHDTLVFRTSVQFADIYFLIDRTGSMGAEMTAMEAQIPNIINFVRCTPSGQMCTLDSECSGDDICFNGGCVENPLTANAGEGCIPDMWTGVGHFHNCNTYNNRVSLQPDPQTTANNVRVGFSGATESVVQSPACVANPNLCTNGNNCGATAGVQNPIGCPGYRPDAVRILIEITDADNQGGTCGGTVPSLAAAGNALQAANIRFVGLHGTGDDGSGTLCTTPQNCAEGLGVAAGTVDQMGQPFAYPALDAAVAGATQQAVLDIVRGVPLNVTIDATDLPGDAGDSLQFIDYLEVNLTSMGCTNVMPVADTDGDMRNDSFPALLPGQPVCWDVWPVQMNTTVMPTAEPQLFRARLTVYGDGSPLDSRDVFFLVPPDVNININ